ncbi:MAG: RimK/LysX family protein [Acidimicrobiia bacterium]|nr:RimK/LysX family protein [Acidimicrobiia bacterium]
MPPTPGQRSLAGWREWVLLPDISAIPLKAKLDTGAGTSALHAFGLELIEHEGTTWAEFEVMPLQRSRAHRSAVRYPVSSFKRIKSSTGHTERRPVIRTPLVIGRRRFKIDITLTSRDEMGFRMLLGRSALRGRFWVDAGASYLLPRPAADGPIKETS